MGLVREERRESSDESSAVSIEEDVGEDGGEQEGREASVEEVRGLETSEVNRREGSFSDGESIELYKPINGLATTFGKSPPRYSAMANFRRGDFRGDGAGSSLLSFPVPFDPFGVLGDLAFGVRGDLVLYFRLSPLAVRSILIGKGGILGFVLGLLVTTSGSSTPLLLKESLRPVGLGEELLISW